MRSTTISVLASLLCLVGGIACLIYAQGFVEPTTCFGDCGPIVGNGVILLYLGYVLMGLSSILLLVILARAIRKSVE